MFRQTDYATTLEKLSEPGTSPDFEDRARMRELLSYLSEEKCLSTGDAARYFRVGSINTIKRWIDRGILRAYMRAGSYQCPMVAGVGRRPSGVNRSTAFGRCCESWRNSSSRDNPVLRVRWSIVSGSSACSS